MKLRWPFRRIVVVAELDYDPTEPNQLPLKKGAQVVVLSKEADHMGWWKGKVNDRVRFRFNILPLMFGLVFTLNSSLTFLFFRLGFSPKCTCVKYLKHLIWNEIASQVIYLFDLVLIIFKCVSICCMHSATVPFKMVFMFVHIICYAWKHIIYASQIICLLIC